MSTIINEWNLLAERFNTHKVDDEIHPDASVNIYVGWPALLHLIESQKGYLGKRVLDIFDYGCGTGSWCLKLGEEGHRVTGTDCAEKMFELAEKKVRGKVNMLPFPDYERQLSLGGAESKYDVVTSIHVFDWIENIDEVLLNLTRLIREGGIILFAVFPKKHIIDSIKIRDLFEDFDSNEDPTMGFANFDGIKVPVYVKESCYYDKFFSNIGFEKVVEYYPPYPLNFLRKFKWTASLCPEMLILAYRKLS